MFLPSYQKSVFERTHIVKKEIMKLFTSSQLSLSLSFGDYWTRLVLLYRVAALRARLWTFGPLCKTHPVRHTAALFALNEHSVGGHTLKADGTIRCVGREREKRAIFATPVGTSFQRHEPIRAMDKLHLSFHCSKHRICIFAVFAFQYDSVVLQVNYIIIII